MKFQIKNIGAIENADIEIEGLTIIAGENNVGKSTVGKALYAFLHDMNIWEKIYDDTCNVRLDKFLDQNSSILDDWCMRVSGAKRKRTNRANQLRKDYAQNVDFRACIEDYQLAEDEQSKSEARKCLDSYLKQFCCDYLSLYTKETAEILEKEDFWVQKWIMNASLLSEKIELDEIKIQSSQIEQSLNEVFSQQYRKIDTKESEIVFVDDMDRKVCFSCKGNVVSLDFPFRTMNRVFFVESPKLFDFLSNTAYGHVQKEYLRYLMSPNVFKKNRIPSSNGFREYGVVKEVSNETLTGITNRLVKVMGGRAEFLQKIGLEFKDNYISEPIHAVNVSTGLKSMALLEYALRIGAIEKGDILILDEPEINLHPEWQIEYARTLVDLQKEFELKIIITTHSPYFMRAIECFTDMSDTMNKLNVYRVSKEKETGNTSIKNVSYSEYGMTDLYDDLSAPLEKLEELLNETYGG